MAAQSRASRSSLSLPRFAFRSRSSDDAIETARAAGVAGTRFWPTLLLVAICQVADLLTFNLAVEVHGPGGELGPLGLVYRAGGFLAVAAVKLGLIGIVLGILAKYPWKRAATRRNLALVVAIIGVFGAFTNAWAYTTMPTL